MNRRDALLASPAALCFVAAAVAAARENRLIKNDRSSDVRFLCWRMRIAARSRLLFISGQAPERPDGRCRRFLGAVPAHLGEHRAPAAGGGHDASTTSSRSRRSSPPSLSRRVFGRAARGTAGTDAAVTIIIADIYDEAWLLRSRPSLQHEDAAGRCRPDSHIDASVDRERSIRSDRTFTPDGTNVLHAVRSALQAPPTHGVTLREWCVLGAAAAVVCSTRRTGRRSRRLARRQAAVLHFDAAAPCEETSTSGMSSARAPLRGANLSICPSR